MIRINRETDYAIRVLLALAKHPQGERLSTAQIRDDMLIPPAFVKRIVAELAQGGFVHTFPGREGGLQLARPSDQMNVLQVIEHFEGEISISDCMTEDLICPFETLCPVRVSMCRLTELIRTELEQLTFSRLALEARSIETGESSTEDTGSIFPVQ